MSNHLSHRFLGSLAALAVAGLVGGCNGSDIVGGTAGQIIGAGGPDGTTKPTVDPTNPHNGGEDTTPPGVNPTVGDLDGDGIPDGQDNIPCKAFYVKVWNQNVSSGSVELNAVEIVATSDFPTTQVIQRFVNPTPGTNTVTFGSKLAGSPEDELHTELWDLDGNLYLHQTVVRGGGAPETPPPITFIINVQC